MDIARVWTGLYVAAFLAAAATGNEPIPPPKATLAECRGTTFADRPKPDVLLREIDRLAR
jgi:hypothetical protein